jgi:type I restriction enzyme S subunit
MSAYRPYPKTKPSGVEWLGDVPEEWVLRPLKFFATFRGGATPSKDNVEFWNGDIPWVSPKDMKRARISDSIDHITEDAILQSSTSRIGVNSLLMVVRSGILQHTIPVAINDVAVTLNQDMRAVAPSRQCRTDFLYYWFVGNNAPLLLELGKQGATVESIEQEYLANTRILIPPLPEQHQIAAFLDRECGKLDALQAKQERLIELLKEKRQALISHAVTRGLDPTAKLKPSGIEWLGDVPQHWRVTKLKRLIRQSTSGPYGSSLTKSMYTTEGFRVYGQQQVIPDDFTIGDYFISPEQYSEMTRYRVLPGDLLVSVMGTVGAAAIVPKNVIPGIINPRLVLYRFIERMISPRYIQAVIRSTSGQGQLLSASNGTTMDGLNMEIIGSLAFPLPPLAEQRTIVAHLDDKCGKIDQLKAKAERGIELLKERRSALISAAVTGKIDVRHT